MDMRQRYGIIGPAVFLLSVLLPAQPGIAAVYASDWITITSPAPRSWNKIDFLDAVHGIVADDSTVFKTADGGRTWKEIAPEKEHSGLRSIEYIDTAAIAIVSYGVLYLSDDAGGTWTKQQEYFNDISFYDRKNGAAGGGPASIFTTTDGGMTWTVVLTLAQRYPLESIVMPSPKLIVSSWTTPHPPGLLDGIFYRSTDGGLTWTLLNLGRSYFPGKIVFGDSTHGMAAAYAQGGTILKTDDAGESWRECYREPSGRVIRSISMCTASEAAALTESGTIVRTTDGGMTWTEEETPGGSKLRVIDMVSSGVTWTAGDSGAILFRDARTTAVQRTESDRAVSGFELLQNYPNPFNPSTSIRFTLPHASRVTLRVYTASGLLVNTLVSERFYPAGTFTATWNTSQENRPASGVYILRMEAQPLNRTSGSFNKSVKMLHLK